MIYWAPFLHFYQPPIQSHSVLKKVCNEAYRPLVKMFIENPQAKVTINICAILSEMLYEQGFFDVLEGLKQIADNKQLEFVESAKYHPILPIIPEKEVKRQIRLNHKTNKIFFKEAYNPRGFFPPEMCYSNELARILSSMGYDWILLSGIACPDEWPMDFVSQFSRGPFSLSIFFRDDILSNKVSFKNFDSTGFISELGHLAKGKEDIYVITAMDAETYGHHIKDWETLFLAKVYEIINVNFKKDFKTKSKNHENVSAAKDKNLEELKTNPNIEVVTISELLDKFTIKKTKSPKNSSWSTTKVDLNDKNYYPLWNDPKNRLHCLQWEHINICLELFKSSFKVKDDNLETKRFFIITRNMLDRALHSCQFWWANKQRGMWDINLINKGLILQEEVVLNAHKTIACSNMNAAGKHDSYYRVTASRDICNKIRDNLLG